MLEINLYNFTPYSSVTTSFSPSAISQFSLHDDEENQKVTTIDRNYNPVYKYFHFDDLARR